MSDDNLDEFDMNAALQDFEEKYAKIYATALSVVAPVICANPDNVVGEGATKLVFTIPGIEDYLLALLKKVYNPQKKSSFNPCDIPLPRYNFGQVMLANDNGLMIMKKSKGFPHSLAAWISHCHRILGCSEPVSKEEAEVFLSKVCDIARMPMVAFNRFALQVKYLNENSLPMDTVNPNNLLINKKDKQINMIDVFDGPAYMQQLKGPINGVRNMEAVLLDSLLHVEYLKALSPLKQELMKCASRIVIFKCQKAAKTVKLFNDPGNVLQYFRLLIKNSSGHKTLTRTNFLHHYLSFVKLYKNELSREKTLKPDQKTIKTGKKIKSKGEDFLQLKADALKQKLGIDAGKTADLITRIANRKIGQEHINIINEVRAKRATSK